MKGAGVKNAPPGRRCRRYLKPLVEKADMNKASRCIRRLYLSFMAALAALLLFCFLPCPPVMAAPALRLNLSSGPVGTQVTITGTVFDSYEGDSIHILFDSVEIPNSPVTIPSQGSFTLSWTVPADASAGSHIVGAKRETSDSTFFISAPFTVDPRQITLNANEGPAGIQLVISGSGFYINEGVTLSYANPAPSAIGTVMASSLGTFSRDFIVPAGVAGVHQITAENARGNTANTTFRVIPDIQPNVDSGAPGEKISVRGTGFGKQSSVTFFLDTTDVATASADDYGTVAAVFTIPRITVSTHYLNARDNAGNTAEFIFPVTAGAILSQDSGPVGGPLTINGNGFQAGSTISIAYDNKPVASAIADNNGKFSITFDVPPGGSGDHVIAVTDGVTTRHYSYTVEKTAPPAPILRSPATKTLTSAFVSFNWQPVTDPSVPVIYELEISSSQDFTQIALYKTALAETHYTLTVDEALKAGPPVSIYYWRVMAVDGAGNRGEWSLPSSFVVGVPPAPSLTMPDNGESLSFPVNLNWTAVDSLAGAVTYHVQVSRNDKFNQLLLDAKGIDSALYTITSENQRIFNKKIPYYWRTRAIDSAGNAGVWSEPASFKISTSGFPAWAAYTLIGLGAVIMIVLAYRYGRRTAYH